VALALTFLLRSSEKTAQPLAIGAHAPSLRGGAVRGGTVDLAGLRGHIVLLSFLNSRAPSTSAGNPSRAQIVFLRSMLTQHARFGLRVILVDAAKIAGAGEPRRNELVNDTYDWNLDPAIALLGDDGSRARRFGVRRVPTTFLIGRDGRVRERWEGLVPAARLDLSIRRLEGRSATD
jgi:hypothetical protein